MTTDTPGGSPPVDDETLRYVAQVFGRRDEVCKTSLFPSNNLESLVITFDTDYYPEEITEVTLEIRAYTDGEFHISYIESRSGVRRRCRWDRHEQPHNSRDHYHPLPDASTESAVDHEYAIDLTRVLDSTVLPWINDRVGHLWE